MFSVTISGVVSKINDVGLPFPNFSITRLVFPPRLTLHIQPSSPSSFVSSRRTILLLRITGWPVLMVRDAMGTNSVVDTNASIKGEHLINFENLNFSSGTFTVNLDEKVVTFLAIDCTSIISWMSWGSSCYLQSFILLWQWAAINRPGYWAPALATLTIQGKKVSSEYLF